MKVSACGNLSQWPRTNSGMSAWIRIAGLAALLAALTASQAQPVRGDNVVSELVAATDAVVPGQELSAGLLLKHDPHWHTYWVVPGDSGLPTQIRWNLPPGWSAGPIEWPVPKRLPIGPLMNFGYENEVLLPVRLSVPADVKPGDLAYLSARADWLICKDVCIPGGADLKLVMPVKAGSAPSVHADRFEATRRNVPQPMSLAQGAAAIESDRVRIDFAPQERIDALEFFPLEEARIEPAAPQVLRSEAGKVSLYLTAAQPVAPEFKRLRGVLVANGGAAHAGGWAGIVDLALAPAAVASPAADARAVADAPIGPSIGFWTAAFGALIGGLILNLMPCVFPVLSLKLLSLMQHRRAEDEAHLRHPPLALHGAAFGAGVVLSFVLLAGGLLALRAGGEQLGWGFQLQTPWVVAILTALFFLIGLNLLGAFEFGFGAGIASSGAAQRLQSDRVSGSFWTGVLAVVVAAPCTAPFMGAALGYAVTQPAAVAITVFALLGVGMALPYVVLTLAPGLARRLPRPGAWMERFKQVMAFPMFLTCVWLIWVLAQQVDINAVGLLLVALVLLGLAAWSFGLVQRGAGRWRWVAFAAAGLAVYAGVSATAVPPGATRLAGGERAAEAGEWRAWSPAAVKQAIDQGNPVFVDFTAAWCVTCQANKRLVLQSDAVERAFADSGVVRMRADWTNRDAQIAQELARFNRNGVPLYVLFDRTGKAQVLPELLTERIVVDALGRL